MSIHQVKKYKTIKDKNGNKVQVPKTTEEWNKETRNGTMTWYFSTRYEINNKIKQYKSKLFALKRETQEEERIFLSNPIEYIQNNSKRAKNNVEIIKSIDTTNNKNLNSYFDDFLDYYIKYIKEGTIYGYRSAWNMHLLETFGPLLPQELNLAIVQEWHEKMGNKINPRTGNLYNTQTKNACHYILNDFMQFLYHKGLIEFNYSKTVGSFRNPNINKNEQKKVKYQTLEQYEQFMEIVDDEFWYTFFNFAFWHGPRRGEQRALKIKDIDLKNNIVHFHKTFSRNKNGGEKIGAIKNGKERFTYIAEQSKPYIKKLISFYKEMDGYSNEWFLFGGPFNTYKNRIERVMKKYYKILKEKYPDEAINELTHHEFGRHSHASFLLNVGCDREDIYFIIAERLGDTPEVIRRTYAKPYENLNNDKSKQLLSNENIQNKLKEMR